MTTHLLEREQWLPISIGEAWSFFSSPLNLAKITPDDMGFVIRQPFQDKPIYKGQLITYTVSPLLGIPLKWVTRIAKVEAHHRFVDTQITGPYKLWWHQHTFIEKDGGTLMKDKVEYRLPLGPLGELAHGWFVRKKLEQIFDFRFRALEKHFGTSRSGDTLVA